jgi:hypothetical protein
MRLIKLLVISFFVLATIITSISLLFPSEVVVSRAIEINAPSQDIAYFVSDLNHWNTWMSEWKENKVTIKDSTAFISSQTIQLIKSTDSSATVSYTHLRAHETG